MTPLPAATDSSTERSLHGMIIGDHVERSGVAARARALLPLVGRWDVVSVSPEPPDIESGQTGFAGPVLTPDEAQRLVDEQRVEAIGVASATARGLGPHPARQTVVAGGAAALLQHVAARRPDVVVVSGAARPTAVGDLEDLAAGCTALLVVGDD